MDAYGWERKMLKGRLHVVFSLSCAFMVAVTERATAPPCGHVQSLWAVGFFHKGWVVWCHSLHFPSREGHVWTHKRCCNTNPKRATQHLEFKPSCLSVGAEINKLVFVLTRVLVFLQNNIIPHGLRWLHISPVNHCRSLKRVISCLQY